MPQLNYNDCVQKDIPLQHILHVQFNRTPHTAPEGPELLSRKGLIISSCFNQRECLSSLKDLCIH